MNVKVGQTVYLEPHSNAARSNSSIVTAEVSNVGRKWFEVNGRRRDRFDIATGWQDGKGYSPDWRAHETMQEILDKREAQAITLALQRDFGHWGKIDLTLDQLRRISAIVAEKKEVAE